jgi:uncharacterized Zn finger protein
MLVKLGRTQEAFDFGMQHLANPKEALALAQALHARGETEQALRIAEHGLDLGSTQDGPIYYGYSNKSELARWLRDEARNVGQTDRALRGGRAVLESQPSLKDYLTLQSIAGEGWTPLREAVLAALRTRPSHYREPEIQIYLHEGLIDDAIAALGSHAHYSLLEQVAEAAKKTHPEWVIQVSKKQAESIMDAGQASAYEHAAEWLAKARTAYLALGRKAEWDTYLAGVMATHQRKYKLMPMLRKLV